MPDDLGEPRRRHPILERLEEQRERHLARSRLYRVVVAGAGFTMLAAGLAMLVLPGPGLLVIVLGLGVLALEFAWAERLLERAIDKMDQAKDTAARASRPQKVGGVVALTLGLAALVAGAIVWDLPLLPF